MSRTRLAVAALVIFGGGIAYGDYQATPGSGLTFGSLVVGGVHYATQAICDATVGKSQCVAVSAGGAVKVDNSAVTQPTSAASGSVASGAVASGAFASGSVASGAFASGSIASGAMVDLGSQADAACSTDTGTCSLIALIKKNNQDTSATGLVQVQAVASGGWTPKWFIAANSDNSTNLKNAAGVVHAVQVFGINAAPAYLKFYDKASAPTCGSDTIVKQIMIPAASTAANGAGAVAVTLDAQFVTGISYCVVTGIGATDDTSVTAANFVVNIDYK